MNKLNTHQAEVYGSDEYVDVVVEVVVTEHQQRLLYEASLAQRVYQIAKILDTLVDLYDDHDRVVARSQIEPVEVIDRLLLVDQRDVCFDQGHVGTDSDVARR